MTFSDFWRGLHSAFKGAGVALALMGPIIEDAKNDKLDGAQAKLEEMAGVWARDILISRVKMHPAMIRKSGQAGHRL